MSSAACSQIPRVSAQLADPGAGLGTELTAHVAGCAGCRRAASAAIRCWPAGCVPTPSLIGCLNGPLTVASLTTPESLAVDQAVALELGPYLLLDRLDVGGMGEVYRAWHRLLMREDAVKTVRPELTADPVVVRRFLREAESAAKLRHPNVVTVYAADQIDGRYYLAMELVPGVDLGKLVRAGGPLPVATACEYVRQAAEGLEHAFRSGLVHRDVKPANLLLGADGLTVKVADFGLARALDPNAGSAVTRPGAVLGTVDYMAPEQAEDPRSADARSDVYSLGCTLYFLLTEQVPFPGGSLRERLNRHAGDRPPSVRVLRPRVPVTVDNIIRKCLAKRPRDRYQTPAELAAALTAAVAASAGSNLPGAEPRTNRRWLWAGVAILGLVAVCAVVASWPFVRSRPEERSVGSVLEGGGRTAGAKNTHVKKDEATAVQAAVAAGILLPRTEDRSPWRFSTACWSENRSAVRAVGFMPDGSVHAGRESDASVKPLSLPWEAWPATGGGKPTHSGRTGAPAETETPVLISAGGYYTTRLMHYEPQTLRSLGGLSDDASLVDRGRTPSAFCLFATADGASLVGDAAAEDGNRRKVRLVVRWDAKTGRVRGGWAVSTRDLLRDVAPDRTGETVATGTVEGKVIRLAPDSRQEWDAPNGPDGNPDRVWSIALSPDGRTVYSGHDGRRVLVWDAGKAAASRELPIGAWSANRLQVSSDGRWLVAVGGGGVRVWDLRADPPEGYTLDEGWQGNLNRVVFNGDGTRLAVGGERGVIWVWDLAR